MPRPLVPLSAADLVRELKALLASESVQQRPPTLQEFLKETGLELSDIYKSGSWSGLKREAGAVVPGPGPHEANWAALSASTSMTRSGSAHVAKWSTRPPDG